MLLAIHIAAGGLAIILGATALVVKKGGPIHRRVGMVFVGAMLTMGFSASLLGFRKSPTDGNVFAGLMVFYFVGTALLTVRPITTWTRRINIVLVALVLGLAFLDILGGVQALRSPHGTLKGVPFGMFFFLALIKLLAAVGDVRFIRFGGLRAGARLARHLWRMCFALFIAAGSFFSIRARVAKVLPEPFTTAPMRALPIVLLFAAMFYWLWRVRTRRTLPVVVRHEKVAIATRAK